jgi:hypothetical protein
MPTTVRSFLEGGGEGVERGQHFVIFAWRAEKGGGGAFRGF